MLQKAKMFMNRTRQRFEQMIGKADKTTDDEYAVYKLEFKDMDKRYYRIFRGMKRLLDSMRSMSMAQRTLAKDIDLFYEEDSPMKARAQEYVTVGEEIAGAADRCMNDRYIMDVLEPVKKILDKIEEVRNSIDYRWTCQLEFDYYRNKLKRLQEKKGGVDPDQIKRNEEKMAACKVRYEEANQRCIADCTELSENRYKMFDYTFCQLMSTQAEFFESTGRTTKALRTLTDVMPERFIFGVSEDSEAQAEAILNQGPRQVKDRREKPGVLGSLLGKKAPTPLKAAAEAVSGKVADTVKSELAAHGFDAESDDDLDLRRRSEDQGKRCRALYDYQAQEDGELTLFEGDIVYVTQEDESGWSSGTRELNGEQGLFPASYVTPAPAEEELRRPPPRPVSKPVAALNAANVDEPEPAAAAPAANPMMEEMARRMKKLQSADSDIAAKMPSVPTSPVSDDEAEAAPEQKKMPTPPVKKMPAPPVAVAVPTTPTPAPKPRTPVASTPPAAAAATAVAACGTCGCDQFKPHSFKKGQCNNCFHVH